jgi:hypothetical protein
MVAMTPPISQYLVITILKTKPPVVPVRSRAGVAVPEPYRTMLLAASLNGHAPTLSGLTQAFMDIVFID